MSINTIRFFITCLAGTFLLTHPGCDSSRREQAREGNGDDLFADNIRRTEFQVPKEEQAGFILPPGFEISLFASEPDISKPINMEFDAGGRLWVTHTSEYPMPAPPGNGKDRITILEDTDGDGRADKFTPFAGQLNIPIGLTPVKAGAIAYSIPNIYRFTDLDGDGTADEKKKLIGPFEYIDTHGMVNNLIRGFDGWIHACHGYANTSIVAGADGDSITMVSGNTFRFREDGSRVEATTFGRINPFGFAFDEWGYLYSLDCHTRPIYQLIPGAQYPAQGVKAPAMGWAPEMMSYEFGSTANSGLVFYTGEQFPEAYRNNFFSGNVVTSRINRNTMTLHGSTPESKREEDFLISKDPWFRPVDIKMGPDGALYVADFYNRIIGHYEVPKDHPGRDRVSGRIWKITYKGDQKNTPAAAKDLSKASLEELIGGLDVPQLNVRMAIANQIVDVYGAKAVVPVAEMMEVHQGNSKSYIQGLWILYRLNSLPEALLEKALGHNDPMVQVHALRVLAERKTIRPGQYESALVALAQPNPQVARIAAQALGVFPGWDGLVPLLDLYSRTPVRDTHLKYTCLLSIRDHLSMPDIMKKVSGGEWNEEQLALLMLVMLEIPSEEAASFVLNYLRSHSVSGEQMSLYLAYISRYIAAEDLDEVILLIRENAQQDVDKQFELYQIIRRSSAQRGGRLSRLVKEWGIAIAGHFLTDVSGRKSWMSRPAEADGEPQNPWTSAQRSESPGFPAAKSITSQLNGPEQTGVLYSAPFKLPASLSMVVFDNDLTTNAQKKGRSQNAVRVRLSGTNELLDEYRLTLSREAKQGDELNKVNFDLQQYTGQIGYLEVLDSSKAGFIGISVPEPELFSIPDRGPGEYALRYIKAAEIAADYRATALEPALKQLLADPLTDARAQLAAAEALMLIAGRDHLALLKGLFTDQQAPGWLRGKMALILAQSPSPDIHGLLEKNLSAAGPLLKQDIILALVSSEPGIDYFLQALKTGSISELSLGNLLIRERMNNHISLEQKKALDRLIGASPRKAAREQLLRDRLAAYDPASVTLERGHLIFAQNCSPCHTIGHTGGTIGPQLNGIGTWGLHALAEKILDPNRNISEAFRTYTITLNNGKILSGLYRREEGELLVFADLGGEEFSVPKGEIRERKASAYTLMPDNFGNTIEKEDFDALLNYLLSLKEN